MKKILKKPLSIILSVVMVFSAFAFSLANAEVNTFAAQTEAAADSAGENSYGLAENIRDGAILHAWCWSFNTIKANLQKIAEAGFTSVQTSPVNECKVGEGGGMDIYGNGKWYYHYQPTKYTIGNYQLGTKEDFESLCKEAEKYGIKIIVDAVVNHCTSDYNAISDEIKNIEGGAFHDFGGIDNYADRYQCTQGDLLGLIDLNTQNPNVQQMILNYLKSCVAAGADGFRYDGAKHIELPDDTSKSTTEKFASDVWPTILANGAEFQYGEILQGDNERISAYANYLDGVTASNYGSTIRNAAISGNFRATTLSSYNSGGAPTNKLVTWVESHDNYCNDGSWKQIDDQDVRQAWAVISATGDTTPLFFSRPDGSSTSNQWGKNVIGNEGDYNYYHPEVAAVNQFRNAMIGEPKKLSNPTGSSKLLMIERGSSGAVLVNASDSDVTLDCITDVADGTYTDAVSGSTFTVSGGKLSGTVQAGAIAVVYDNDGVIKRNPIVQISQEGGTFRGTLTLTLTSYYTTTATYKIGNNTPVEYKSGDTITIGSDMAENDSVDITLYGKNDDGEVTKTYTFTKLSSPIVAGNTVIYFDNSQYKWNSVNLYVYYNDGAVMNSPWPGLPMTDLGGNMWAYTIEDEFWDGFSDVNVIFNNGAEDGAQFPASMEPGYIVKKGDIKIFNGSGLSDYKIDDPIVPSTTISESTTATSGTTNQETTTNIPGTTTPSDDLLIGDVDGNGQIDVKDVTYIQKHLVKYTDSNGQPLIDENDSRQFKIADVNGDNHLNVNDVTQLQKIIAKLV